MVLLNNHEPRVRKRCPPGRQGQPNQLQCKKDWLHAQFPIITESQSLRTGDSVFNLTSVHYIITTEFFTAVGIPSLPHSRVSDMRSVQDHVADTCSNDFFPWVSQFPPNVALGLPPRPYNWQLLVNLKQLPLVTPTWVVSIGCLCCCPKWKKIESG